MIYPDNFEKKIGFDTVRGMLRDACLTHLGIDEADALTFTAEPSDVLQRLQETHEWRQLAQEDADFCLERFYDSRTSIKRLRLQGTHIEEQELFELLQSLKAASSVKQHIISARGELSDDEDDEDNEEQPGSVSKTKRFHALWQFTQDVNVYPNVIRRLNGVLDKYGHIKDSASSTLFRVRRELSIVSGSISQTLNSILRQAQAEGYVERDVTPAIRDGRLVIPVAPAMKRRIQGIVHDESTTGKTLFIEPAAVIEANNKIHELEAEEHREVMRILTEISDELRPHAEGLLNTLQFLAHIDLLQAKARLAEVMNAIEPNVLPKPHLDWIAATHPLLKANLARQGQSIVPLDITLQRGLLVISGPNAGGKSVCLKTVGLLQYMMQCGLSVPMSERSTMGLFRTIMIDIGDEQSIDDDLSTYSSHLRNMRNMIRNANPSALLLIDEFGAGTEPQIGGAIAEAVLRQFWKRRAWGVITTHYQNLKHFADEHPGVENGAMLYDRHQMRALFQLQIGRPGSSFAIEIARKIGLPEEVINDASEIVGQDYIQSDKYLQDIVRDKRYWEQKRQSVHQKEKDVERTISRFERSVEEIDAERKAILRRAKEQAEALLKEANRRIENTIKEIREAEAEKNATRLIRQNMEEFRQEVSQIDTKANDELIERKMQQILARRERSAKNKEKKAQDAAKAMAGNATAEQTTTSSENAVTLHVEQDQLTIGAFVHIKGTKSVGIIDSIQGKNAIVRLGDMLTRMSLSKLEIGEKPTVQQQSIPQTHITRAVIDEHKGSFRQEIDVRGLRGEEALLAVQRFIDDAILMGSGQVRILHGKGDGILRQLIRDYLSGIPNVLDYHDEHVQLGGSGITVVSL